jgi:hypothetical protein
MNGYCSDFKSGKGPKLTGESTIMVGLFYPKQNGLPTARSPIVRNGRMKSVIFHHIQRSLRPRKSIFEQRQIGRIE